jgi:hypothetical protein
VWSKLPYIMFGVAVLILAIIVGWNNVQLQQQVDNTQTRLGCVSGKSVEKDVAQLEFDIAYSRFVQALGGDGDPVQARDEIVAKTDRLEEVRDSRLLTEQQCGSGS